MDKPVKNMLGVLGTPKHQLRDSDGDGVPNTVDCEPHNPNKQGLIHDVGKRVARKTLRGRFRHRAVKFIERKQKEAEEVRKIRIEARQKERLETAKFREEQRGIKRREVIKKGGAIKRFTSGFSAPTGTRTISGRKKPKRISSPASRGESIQGFFDKRFPGGL